MHQHNLFCLHCHDNLKSLWALFICISYYLKKKAFFFLCALVLYRFCWDKFGWGGDKSNELLVPVLKEYEKREVRLMHHSLSHLHAHLHMNHMQMPTCRLNEDFFQGEKMKKILKT